MISDTCRNDALLLIDYCQVIRNMTCAAGGLGHVYPSEAADVISVFLTLILFAQRLFSLIVSIYS